MHPVDLQDLQADLRYLVAKLQNSLHAVVWLSKARDAIVVCPQAQTEPHGVLYEVGPGTFLPYEATSDEDLGTAILLALKEFKYSPRDLYRDRSGWPSYLASKAKSQADFTLHFLSAQVELSKGTTTVEVMPEGEFNISVVGPVGYPDPTVLGAKVFHAYHCCRLLRDEGLLT
jgi:hypothetical protein